MPDFTHCFGEVPSAAYVRFTVLHRVRSAKRHAVTINSNIFSAPEMRTQNSFISQMQVVKLVQFAGVRKSSQN